MNNTCKTNIEWQDIYQKTVIGSTLSLLKGHCGSGKSTTVLNVALKAMQDNIRVCYVSTEESKLDVRKRLDTIFSLDDNITNKVDIIGYRDIVKATENLNKKMSDIAKKV